MSIGLAVHRSAQRYPDRAAAFDSRRTLSYAEVDQRSARLANLLRQELRLERGSRIALLCGNRSEVVEVLAGVAKAAMVYIGLNFRMDRSDLLAVFENAAPSLLITEASSAAHAEYLREQTGVPVLDLDASGPSGYEGRLAQASAQQPDSLRQVRAWDELCLVYSSGTTGRPKGILFDHAAALQHALVAALEYAIDHRTRYLVQIPHNASVNITIIPCLVMGAAVGFAESRRFEPDQLLHRFRGDAITHTFLVPTMLSRILGIADPHIEDWRSVTTVGYGSAPIPADHARELLERYGPIFMQLYGMAEIASIGTILRKDDHQLALAERPELLQSCGQPSYGVDVRVIDDGGVDLSPGAQGEVIFGGSHLMLGYYRDPERTAEALRDGWVYSGDIGRWDVDGYLYIVDRKKDLVIRGGFNIAPNEIERVLQQHPAVAEAAVIGVPDPEWGEAVLAVVALHDGDVVGADALIGHCRAAGLAGIKVPGRIEFRAELPRNAVGKVAKRELRDSYWPGERRV